MNYSLQNLTAVSECDMLLSWATREKAGLSHRKMTGEFNTIKFAQTAAEIAAALVGVNAELQANEMVIASVPAGSDAMEEAIDKKVRLEYKKFLLENRKENFGATALIEKEVDLARVDQELNEVEAFMALVTEKKNMLLMA